MHNVLTYYGYDEYKWYKDGVLIDTTTSSSIIVTENGHYSVQYLKECGYSGISVAVEIIIEPCADLSIQKTIENEGINTVSFKISVKNNNPYFESFKYALKILICKMPSRNSKICTNSKNL